MYSSSLVSCDGNLAQDVFYRGQEGDKQSFAAFTVALSTGKDTAIFVGVKCFGITADQCQSLTKGQKVVVKGRLSDDSYEKDGVKVKGIGITADTVGFVNKQTQTEEF